MKKASLTLFILILILGISDAQGQCSMCSAVVSSNLDGEAQATGTGINRGILFLMAFPYLLGMGFLYYFFRVKINAFASRLLKKNS